MAKRKTSKACPHGRYRSGKRKGACRTKPPKRATRAQKSEAKRRRQEREIADRRYFRCIVPALERVLATKNVVSWQQRGDRIFYTTEEDSSEREVKPVC